MSEDHKPGLESEKNRIIQNGGKIYQTEIPIFKSVDSNLGNHILKGPLRVFPGRLSVCRAFGDPESKIKKYGGIPGVIIAKPEIRSFEIQDQNTDFLLLGCDGIFDKLENEQVIQYMWDCEKECNNNIHQFVGLGIKNILKQSMIYKSFDNITVLIVSFPNLERYFTNFNGEQKKIN